VADVTKSKRASRVLLVAPLAHELDAMEKLLLATAEAGEFTVSRAADVAGALGLFRREHPDIILLSTSDMLGFGKPIVEQVRASQGSRHTGLVFVGLQQLQASQVCQAYDTNSTVSCLELGADDYIRTDSSSAEMLARVRVVLRFKSMTDELRHANHRLQVLSMTDELTGLANMRCFNQRYAALIAACRRGDLALGVLMMDVDHFKAVNDATTHLVGSHVLSEIGQLLVDCGHFHDLDVVARFGGDEFIVAVAAQSLKELTDKAESIRQSIAAASFHCDGQSVRVTTSIGVAWVARGFPGRSEDLVKAADLMLYRSKNSGRNRVSAMVLKYPVDLGSDQAQRLARRGKETLAREIIEAELLAGDTSEDSGVRSPQLLQSVSRK
jgi:diguanylate cyclase (GGDEF)-like protein